MTKTTIITDLGTTIQVAITGSLHSVTTKYIFNKETFRIQKTENLCIVTNADSFNQGKDNKILELDYRRISSPSYASNDELYAGLVGMQSTTSAPVESLVTGSDIGAVSDTWIEQGEVSCGGCKTLAIWVDFTVNDSQVNTMQILCRKTSGGDAFVLETIPDYQKTFGNNSIKVLYSWNVEGVSFVSVQTKAETLGTIEGTVTIDITKEY